MWLSLLKIPYFKMAAVIVLAGIGIILAIYITSLKVALGSARGDLAEARGVISNLETQNADLIQKNNSWRLAFHDVQTIAGKCNAAVEKLQIATEKAKSNALESIKKNSDILAARQDQINRATGRPANPTGECTASVTLAKQDLRGKS